MLGGLMYGILLPEWLGVVKDPIEGCSSMIPEVSPEASRRITT